jgi:hypothetical protein
MSSTSQPQPQQPERTFFVPLPQTLNLRTEDFPAQMHATRKIVRQSSQKS